MEDSKDKTGSESETFASKCSTDTFSEYLLLRTKIGYLSSIATDEGLKRRERIIVHILVDGRQVRWREEAVFFILGSIQKHCRRD